MRTRKGLPIFLGVLVLQAMLLGTPEGSWAEPGINGPLLQQWVRERDEAAHEMLSLWLDKVPVSELKPHLRRLAEYELLIMSACAGVRTCTEQYVVLSGRGFTPQSAPALILEKVYGINLDIAPLFLGKSFPGEPR